MSLESSRMMRRFSDACNQLTDQFSPLTSSKLDKKSQDICNDIMNKFDQNMDDIIDRTAYGYQFYIQNQFEYIKTLALQEYDNRTSTLCSEGTDSDESSPIRRQRLLLIETIETRRNDYITALTEKLLNSETMERIVQDVVSRHRSQFPDLSLVAFSRVFHSRSEFQHSFAMIKALSMLEFDSHILGFDVSNSHIGYRVMLEKLIDGFRYECETVMMSVWGPPQLNFDMPQPSLNTMTENKYGPFLSTSTSSSPSILPSATFSQTNNSNLVNLTARTDATSIESETPRSDKSSESENFGLIDYRKLLDTSTKDCSTVACLLTKHESSPSAKLNLRESTEPYADEPIAAENGNILKSEPMPLSSQINSSSLKLRCLASHSVAGGADEKLVANEIEQKSPTSVAANILVKITPTTSTQSYVQATETEGTTLVVNITPTTTVTSANSVHSNKKNETKIKPVRAYTAEELATVKGILLMSGVESIEAQLYSELLVNGEGMTSVDLLYKKHEIGSLPLMLLSLGMSPDKIVQVSKNVEFLHHAGTQQATEI